MADWLCVVPSGRLLRRRERDTAIEPSTLEKAQDPLLADNLAQFPVQLSTQIPAQQIRLQLMQKQGSWPHTEQRPYSTDHLQVRARAFADREVLAFKGILVPQTFVFTSKRNFDSDDSVSFQRLVE